eukprot:scpid35538/ scgid30957/ 
MPYSALKDTKAYCIPQCKTVPYRIWYHTPYHYTSRKQPADRGAGVHERDGQEQRKVLYDDVAIVLHASTVHSTCMMSVCVSQPQPAELVTKNCSTRLVDLVDCLSLSLKL